MFGPRPARDRPPGERHRPAICLVRHRRIRIQRACGKAGAAAYGGSLRTRAVQGEPQKLSATFVVVIALAGLCLWLVMGAGRRPPLERSVALMRVAHV